MWIARPKIVAFFHVIKARYSTKIQKWKSVVGLEVHAQINSQSKLFSGSSTAFGCHVNDNVSFFDAATPGTLPVLNRRCVDSAILTALAMSCHVNLVSCFDRKHYFYADLPAGYQITQQKKPLAADGQVQFEVYTPGVKRRPYVKSSRLKQVQIEQDSGKSLHEEDAQRSLIDLNRAGVPLMELVFEPDLSGGEEAAALVKELCLILQRINTCSCRMEEGALRVDANISVMGHSETKLGVRTEVKNISSIRAVARAVDFEIQRQIECLERKQAVENETRFWDAVSSTTVGMRDKEMKQDYRFMPEPNLPPLRLENDDIERLRSTLPELPDATRNRLQTDYNLTRELTIPLVAEPFLLNLFETTLAAKKSRDPKIIAKLIVIEFLTFVNKGLATLPDDRVSEFSFGEITDLLQSGAINFATTKHLLEELFQGNPLCPSEIVDKLGLRQINDADELKKICFDVVENNPQIVQQYKKGKNKVFYALLGVVAKQTNQRADMKQVEKILRELLGS